jgi:hypothetical protein
MENKKVEINHGLILTSIYLTKAHQTKNWWKLSKEATPNHQGLLVGQIGLKEL